MSLNPHMKLGVYKKCGRDGSRDWQFESEGYS